VPAGEDRKGKFASPASPSSPTAETRDFLGDANGDANGGDKDICVTAPNDDASVVATVTANVTNNVLKNAGNDASDESDAKIPTSYCERVAFYSRLGLPHAEGVSLAMRTRQGVEVPKP